jgi:hypothetical protein
LAAIGALTLTGCTRRIAPLAPAALPQVSREDVARWIADLTPQRARLFELRWRYETQKGAVAGRAAARFAPPDSLRFDYRAPFGRSGAAVIIGDSARWIQPRGDADFVSQVAPLLWAGLGIPRLPPSGAPLWGERINDRRVWRYALGADTVEFRYAPRARSLETQARTAGELRVSSVLEFSPATGLPVKADMVMPETAARFTLTVERVDTLARHDREIWDRR